MSSPLERMVEKAAMGATQRLLSKKSKPEPSVGTAPASAKLLVSATAPGASRSIVEALQQVAPPSQVLDIVVEPGFWMTSVRITGANVRIRAAAGTTPEQVVLYSPGGRVVTAEGGRLVLEGVTLSGGGQDRNTLDVMRGAVELTACAVVSSAGNAIGVAAGAQLTMTTCVITGCLSVVGATAGIASTTFLSTGRHLWAVAASGGASVSMRGVTVEGSGLRMERSGVSVVDSTVSRPADAGIFALDGSNVRLARVSLSETSEPHASLVVRGSVTLEAEDCVLGDRIEVSDSTVAVHGGDVTGCQDTMPAVAAVGRTRLTLRDLAIRSAGGGINVADGAQLEVEQVSITAADLQGLLCDGGSARVTGTRITGAHTGIVAVNGAHVDLNDVVLERNDVGLTGWDSTVTFSGDSRIVDSTLEGIRWLDSDDAPTGYVTLEGNGRENAFDVDCFFGARANRDAWAAEHDVAAPFERLANDSVAGVDADGADPEDVDSLLRELDAFVGLASVKEDVRRTIDLVRVQQQRAERTGRAPRSLSRHMVFAGAPGTGKTSVAQLYGRLLYAIGAVPSDTFVEAGYEDLVTENVGGTPGKTKEVIKSALGGVLFIDEAYRLAVKSGSGEDFGKQAIDTLLKVMEDHRDELVVILAGYTAEMDRFLDSNPGLRRRIPKTILFENYSSAELVEITAGMAERDGFHLADDVAPALVKHFSNALREKDFGNAGAARNLYEAAIVAQAGRLAERERAGEEITDDEFDTLTAADFAAGPGLFSEGSRDVRDQAQVDRLLAKLESMTGLESAKAQIRSVVDSVQAALVRRERGLDAVVTSPHLVFAGAPGTGKTSVARLYGELLAALGVLATGQIKEVGRADLVGQYVGETAIKTKSVFAEARGGVLFIDEAYSLGRASGGGNDFGSEAIDTLVDLMEKERDAVTVIAAGYVDDMKDFLRLNAGLERRFSVTVDFESYTGEELGDIFLGMVTSQGWRIAPRDEPPMRALISDNAASFAGTNAGGIRNVVEAAARNLDRRVAQARRDGLPLSDDALVTIEIADVEAALPKRTANPEILD